MNKKDKMHSILNWVIFYIFLFQRNGIAGGTNQLGGLYVVFEEVALAQAGSLRRGLLENPAVKKIAREHRITEMQVLLGFVLHKQNVIAIPRSGRKEHVLQNWAMQEIRLTEEECSLLDQIFPVPKHKTYLDIV